MKPITSLLLPLALGLVIIGVRSWTQAEPLPSDKPPKSRKAMIIGLDGLRSDALKLAVETGRAPFIAELIASGSVTWHAMSGGWTPSAGDPTIQATYSGPGWSSVLTGVWRDKHGVNSNDFKGQRFDLYPALFKRLHGMEPSASSVSLVSWKPINDHIVSPLGEEICACLNFTNGSQSQTDADLTSKTLELLETSDPTLVFYYQGNIDAAGHRFGFSPEVSDYMDAIELADARIGRVLKAVRQRPDSAREDWLFVVTSDHGGIGKGHGGHTPEERVIPFIACGGSVPKGMISQQIIGQVAVPATVFRHLHIGIPSSWGWEADGFGNGYRFTAEDHGAAVKLSWSAPPHESPKVTGYQIDRDGVKLAHLESDARSWTDPAGAEGRAVYGLTAVGTGESRWPLIHERPILPKPLAESPAFRIDGESLAFPGKGVVPHGKLRQVPGKIGQALAFDPGVALRLGDAGTWELGEQEDFSIAFWVKLPADWRGDPVFLSNKEWLDGSNPGFAIAAQNGRRNWQWNARGSGSGRKDFDPDGAPLGPDEWHHLAVTHDRGGDAVFYQNGREVGRISISDAGSFDTTHPWWIGQDGVGKLGWEVPWMIDDFQIHRRVLNPGEVLGLHSIQP
jgi:hypothetical protein